MNSSSPKSSKQAILVVNLDPIRAHFDHRKKPFKKKPEAEKNGDNNLTKKKYYAGKEMGAKYHDHDSTQRSHPNFHNVTLSK